MEPLNAFEEINQTVVYQVKIVACNSGAWYRNSLKQKFDCILEIYDKPFGGQEIMFRVMGCRHPVKYIKQQHCLITGQHIASHKEVMGYGNNQRNR